MATCGIYKIQNKINKKVYIGQSVNIERRWKEHKRLLQLCQHTNQHLQNAYNKYGKDNFIFFVVEKCSIDELNDKEKFWINKFDSYTNGYNMDLGGDGVRKYTEQCCYRVIKKGKNTNNNRQRYQLIKNAYQHIYTSIYEDELKKYALLLNEGRITEYQAITNMDKYAASKRSKRSVNYDYDINYLIEESSKGLTQAEIILKNGWTHYYMKKYLKEKQIKWHQIFLAGENLKIKRYDEQNNIQELLNQGKSLKNDITPSVGCSYESMKGYIKENNIKIPQKTQNYVFRSSTNTGIRYVTLLSTGVWQYRRTKQNPNNISRNTYEDLEQTIKERGYIWIIDDKEKCKKAYKKSCIFNKIKNNKKIGKHKQKERKKKRKKQIFAKKRALFAFRKLFPSPKKKKKSLMGVKQLTFSRGDNSWVFSTKYDNRRIKRQNLPDLYKEVIKQGYNWVIDDVKLFHKVIKEVKIYQKERKKPFLERKEHKFNFI